MRCGLGISIPSPYGFCPAWAPSGATASGRTAVVTRARRVSRELLAPPAAVVDSLCEFPRSRCQRRARVTPLSDTVAGGKPLGDEAGVSGCGCQKRNKSMWGDRQGCWPLELSMPAATLASAHLRCGERREARTFSFSEFDIPVGHSQNGTEQRRYPTAFNCRRFITVDPACVCQRVRVICMRSDVFASLCTRTGTPITGDFLETVLCRERPAMRG